MTVVVAAGPVLSHDFVLPVFSLLKVSPASCCTLPGNLHPSALLPGCRNIELTVNISNVQYSGKFLYKNPFYGHLQNIYINWQ